MQLKNLCIYVCGGTVPAAVSTQPMHGALPVLMPCFFMPLSFVCMVAVLL